MGVWVTGRSAVTCVGATPDALWRAALEGRTGVRGGLGAVAHVPEGHRAEELALLGLNLALKDAGWTDLKSSDGLILATTTGQILEWETALGPFLNKGLSADEFARRFQHQPLGELLRAITRRVGFTGKQTMITSACSASTQAFALAAMWLEQGLVERCIVGGVEVLCDLTVQGFSCLQLLSREPAKPFDKDRTGINLSEGAAFLCLEKSTSRPIARLSGYGLSSDGFHMTAPHPEGKGCFSAMRKAIQSANLSPLQIDWIHAHGTGSAANDQAEASAIKALFGEMSPWVCSSKWVHGHALGASGAIESVLCIEALRAQTVFPTPGVRLPDPALGLRHPPGVVRQPVQHILKNTLGFGGINAALVWSVV